MAIEYTSVDAVYRHAGIDSTVIATPAIEEHIHDAEDWVDSHLRTTFKSGGRTVTETVDGDGTSVLFITWGGRDWIDAQCFLTVNSLTVDGTSVTPSKLFVYREEGYIVLKDTAEVRYFSNTEPQQVVVNYTFGHDAVPRIISQLTAIIAAMAALVQQIGGTFDDVTSYSLPEFTASKGEPYTNIRETVTRLDAKAKGILANIRPKGYLG